MDHWLRKALTAFFLAAACIQAARAQQDTLRILAIGNSFSVNALNQNFNEIAYADGCYVIVGDMYIGGCSLQRHFKNSVEDKAAYDYYKRCGVGPMECTKKFTLEKALADEEWDIVTFQQCSPLSGMYSSYRPYLDSLVRYVRERTGEGVRLMWHQTWAYESGATHPNFKDYGCNQHRMFGYIMAASRKCCRKFGFDVIPAGSAIQNLRLTEIGDGCTLDGFHLNAAGCYTIALAWWGAISGRDISGNPYSSPKCSEMECRLARRAAHNACEEPFRLSDDAF